MTTSSAPCTPRARSCTGSRVASRSRWNTGREALKESRRMSEETKLGELDRLISMGKQKGFLTYDEVNDALPADIVSFDQLDDIMMTFGSLDIEVVDNAKAARLPSEVERPAPADRRSRTTTTGPAEPIDLTPGPVGRTEDPGPPLPARDGPRGPAHARGRDRARQAHRGGQEPGHRAPSSPPTSRSSASTSCATCSASSDISVKEVVDVNDEEFTEEKEAALTRQVIGAFTNVDRILRDRDKLVAPGQEAQAPRPAARRRPPRARTPAWRMQRGQGAEARRARSSTSCASMNIGNQIIDREDSDPLRRGLVQRLRVARGGHRARRARDRAVDERQRQGRARSGRTSSTSPSASRAAATASPARATCT